MFKVEWKECLFSCRDQSYTTAVTTSTFPNMHTFLRGPEFCLMLKKLASSCSTSKNATLNEQYPGMCSLIARFPTLCSDDKNRARVNRTSREEEEEEEEKEEVAEEERGTQATPVVVDDDAR